MPTKSQNKVWIFKDEDASITVRKLRSVKEKKLRNQSQLRGIHNSARLKSSNLLKIYGQIQEYALSSFIMIMHQLTVSKPAPTVRPL